MKLSEKKIFFFMIIFWPKLILAGDANVNLNVKVNVTASPCTINNGSPIEFDFGDIPVDKVSDSKYQITKQIGIKCTYFNGEPYIQVTGNPLENNTDGNVLATSIKEFGIALFQGEGKSTKLLIGNGASDLGYKITSGLTNINTQNSLLKITAAPYLNPGSKELSAGTFSASSNIKMSYK